MHHSGFSFGLGFGTIGTGAIAIFVGSLGALWSMICMIIAGIAIIINGYRVWKKECVKREYERSMKFDTC